MPYLFRICLIALLPLFITTCTERHGPTVVSGTVTLESVVDADTIHVGIYPLKHRPRLGMPKQYRADQSGKFSFALEPGQYIIAAFASGHQPYRQPLLIMDRDQRISVTFRLAALVIPAHITSVKTVGDFCQWDRKQAVPLQKTGRYWTRLHGAPLAKGGSYNIMVNGTVVQDLNNPAIVPVKWFAAVNSRYTGDGISFNPSLYFTTPRSSNASLTGAAHHDAFEKVTTRLQSIAAGTDAFYYRRRNASPAEWEQAYRAALDALHELDKTTPSFLKPLLTERRLYITGRFHPANYAITAMFTEGASQDTTLRHYLKGDEYRAFFKHMLAVIKKLPSDSPVLRGTFQHDINRLTYWGDKFPDVHAAHRIMFEELHELLMGFVDNSSLPGLRRALLMQTAVKFSRAGRTQLARDLAARLRNDFPDDKFITDGGVDRLLKQLEQTQGNPAPYSK